jgi:hypothetical protein
MVNVKPAEERDTGHASQLGLPIPAKFLDCRFAGG